jgi:hypothetical protein
MYNELVTEWKEIDRDKERQRESLNVNTNYLSEHPSAHYTIASPKSSVNHYRSKLEPPEAKK